MLRGKLPLLISAVLLTQGCQTTVETVGGSVSEAVSSVKKSWQQAQRRNAESRTKWWYNDRPLMAPKHKDGSEFNVGGKKDTISGFRQFKWSQPLSGDMTLIKQDGLISIYHYNGDLDKRIGGAKLSDIQFGYFDNRLYSVELITDNDADGQALLTALDLTFGRGMAPNAPSEKPWHANYGLNTSPLFVHSNIFHYNKHYGWAEYDCFSDDNPCKATLYSKLEEYKRQEAFMMQADESASDF
ncbi:hypothetical protein [Thalassotalea ganghwensis]